MDLSFGTNVLEHGYSIGRLAGFEADRRSHAIRNIIVGDRRTAAAAVERRPLVSVPSDHFAGDIVLHAFRSAAEAPGGPGGKSAGETGEAGEPLVLSDATRVMRGEQQIGRLWGLEVAPETGEIVAIFARQHWWTRRARVPAAGVDYSVPGVLRVTAATSRAA